MHSQMPRTLTEIKWMPHTDCPTKLRVPQSVKSLSYHAGSLQGRGHHFAEQTLSAKIKAILGALREEPDLLSVRHNAR